MPDTVPAVYDVYSWEALVTCAEALITCEDTVSSYILCIQLDTVSMHMIKASQALPLQALKYIYDRTGVN